VRGHGGNYCRTAGSKQYSVGEPAEYCSNPNWALADRKGSQYITSWIGNGSRGVGLGVVAVEKVSTHPQSFPFVRKRAKYL
jgi:hypothetical protein